MILHVVFIIEHTWTRCCSR